MSYLIWIYIPNDSAVWMLIDHVQTDLPDYIMETDIKLCRKKQICPIHSNK